MLQGQMLPGQMSSWLLESAKECPKNPPLKFGQNRASNSWDMASFLMVNYRDPNNNKNPNFANSVVDFAALSRSWGSVGKLGLQSNWFKFWQNVCFKSMYACIYVSYPWGDMFYKQCENIYKNCGPIKITPYIYMHPGSFEMFELNLPEGA